MNKIQLLACLSIFTLCFSQATFAKFEIKTTNSKIELEKTPQKIAVYDLSVLDTLNALGIESTIVLQSSFTGTLSKYNNEKYIKAGSLFEPDESLLKTTKPDIIFVGGRSAKTAEKLNSIAPTLDFSANTDHYIADLTSRTQIISQAFKRENIANQKLKEISELQSQLKSKTNGKSAIMLFAVGDNFMPHAENDRFGFVYDFAGFNSVLPLTEKSDSPRPAADSPDAIALAQKNAAILKKAIDAKPDYLIVLDRGAVNTQKYTAQDNIHKNSILKNADAVKSNQVIYVNADAWYITGAGLDNTIYMLKELINAIK